MTTPPQVLFLDADDTLWENNIYFERAIERFYSLLGPAGADRAAARAEIDRQERRAIAEAGYGLVTFQRALERTLQALAPQLWNASAAQAVAGLVAAIARKPIEFLPDALEVVRALASRHRLLLLTKGDFAEQTRKVALAGIASLLEGVHVLAEKNPAAFRERLQAVAAPPPSCWMIGNSPRSDINPALAAGMNAILIPHPHTWALELETVSGVCAPGCRCLTLARLKDLLEYF
ncbi:MAG: HAD family hydrolase [Terriglobales bacterium]